MSTSESHYSYKLLTKALQHRASADGPGVIFILGEKDEYFFSYSQLYRESLHILYSLQEQGLEPGDELIVLLSNTIEFVHVFWACLLGGIIPVPVSVYRIERLLNIWKALRSPRIVTSEESAERIEHLGGNLEGAESILGEIKKNTILTSDLSQTEQDGTTHEANQNDIAFLQFTSGSTGNPKGVILTHENLIANCNAMLDRYSVTPEDASLSWMPLTHDMGLIVFHIAPVIVGNNHVIMTTELFARRPQLWMEKTCEYKATVLGAPNFGYYHFLKHFTPEKATHWSLDHVRVILNGAEPISTNLINQFLDTLAPYGLERKVMLPAYGLAEASVGVTGGLVGEEFRTISVDRSSLAIGESIKELDAGEPNSVTLVDTGYPVGGCEVRIVDGDRKSLDENFVGHVLIRGKNVTRGYYNDLEATSEVVTEDGWLDTGDLGFMRGGRLVVAGRLKDVIFVYGKNYYAHDIERIAEEIGGVGLSDVAACGSFSSELNRDEIILFVRFRGKTDDFVPLAQRLKRHINQGLGIEVDHVIPVRRIPKTTSGKMQRYKLRDQYEKGCFQDILKDIEFKMQVYEARRPIVLPETAIEKKILDTWARVLELAPERISTEDPFMSIGGTSFKAHQMLYLAEEELNLKLGERILVECRTIKEMATYIENYLSGQSVI